MQQAIYLNNTPRPDISFSHYLITQTKYNLQIIFYKFSSFHPVGTCGEEKRYEEIDFDEYMSN